MEQHQRCGINLFVQISPSAIDRIPLSLTISTSSTTTRIPTALLLTVPVSSSHIKNTLQSPQQLSLQNSTKISPRSFRFTKYNGHPQILTLFPTHWMYTTLPRLQFPHAYQFLAAATTTPTNLPVAISSNHALSSKRMKAQLRKVHFRFGDPHHPLPFSIKSLHMATTTPGTSNINSIYTSKFIVFSHHR